MIFPVKTVALTANVQNTLVWNGVDFQKSLGYAQPEQPISMTFSVQNNTVQVCYVAISYQTRDVTYNINDRRSIAGIPANTTMRISSNSAAELAALGPNLVSVTFYLISAASGNVLVTAEGFDKVVSPGSVGSGQNIGLDQRSILDYIQLRLYADAVVPGAGTNFGGTYTVPEGKRVEIVSFTAQIDPTPFGSGDCVVLVISPIFRLALRSEMFDSAILSIAGGLGNLEAGELISLNLINDNPVLANGRQMVGIVIMREYFS